MRKFKLSFAIISLLIVNIGCNNEDEVKVPESEFVADKTDIKMGENVNFTDISQNNPTGWNWDFGDNSTSETQNPSHTYKLAGNYTVSLYAKNEKGGDHTEKQDYIKVTPTTGNLQDTRDGKIYKTVKIGNQWWMAENLNYETEGSTAYRWSEENANVYGLLYNYAAAINACPDGWHLPSRKEYETLINYIGDEPGNALKSDTTLWQNYLKNTNGSGFSALPGGECPSSFQGIGELTSFWTSTIESFQHPVHFSLFYNNKYYQFSYYVDVYEDSEYFEYYIRCVKN
ncbi:MAG: PKD domain-containing protein [Bacteroidetes bacterium]|nr:PKD domain-containing protein [Bacteroidota bacterium]